VPGTGLLRFGCRNWVVEGKYGVKRAAFGSRVKQGGIEGYKKLPRCGPKMLNSLGRAVWTITPFFLNEHGLVVGYFETPHDFDTAQNAIVID
jgi:hypothetical protein